MTFQDLVLGLERYWAARGCVIAQPYDLEVGAGTMHPATFLRALGPEPWRVAYVQPSRRPDDVQDAYLRSLRALGIELRDHDLRFLEDDWADQTLGASGVGWQVFLDGQEISQFTYFQQAGGLELPAIPVELTYGLERIAQFVLRKDNVFDLEWAPGITYGEIRREDEFEHSTFAFETADVDMLRHTFAAAEAEAGRLLDAGLTVPAYEHVLRCSHTFNLLDARGAVGVAERASLMARCRVLARRCAEQYLKHREELGWPLLRGRPDAA